MMNMGALISNEHGYSGMQGRGFFAGVSGYGFHAEYSQNGGFDWGGSSQVATAKYDSENGYKFHHAGQDIKQSYDEIKNVVLSVRDFLKAKHYERFSKQAEWEADLDTYDKFLSYCVELGEACYIMDGFEAKEHNVKGDNTNIKGLISSDWSEWNSIFNRYPDIELVYNQNIRELVKNWARGSYNYGHNVLTHFFLDWIPHHIWSNPY